MFVCLFVRQYTSYSCCCSCYYCLWRAQRQKQQLILHRYNSVNYTFDFSARKIIVNVVVIATESVDLVLLEIFPQCIMQHCRALLLLFVKETCLRLWYLFVWLYECCLKFLIVGVSTPRMFGWLAGWLVVWFDGWHECLVEMVCTCCC